MLAESSEHTKKIKPVLTLRLPFPQLCFKSFYIVTDCIYKYIEFAYKFLVISHEYICYGIIVS